MAVVTTATHPKLLWPGLHSLWEDWMYKAWPELYSKVLDVKTSEQAFEEVQGITSLGMMPVKGQGAPLIYEAERQGFNKRFTHVAYALGTQVTKEEIQDNLYMKKGEDRVKMLGRSGQETVETVSFNIFNRATDSNYAGADGKELLATDHPNVSGGTWQNEPTTGTDLSETALEDMIILMMQAENDVGLKAMIRPNLLLVHPNEYFNAKRILGSDRQNDTANNATNVLKDGNWFPGGCVVSPYLTNSDDWFIKTDVEKGGWFFWRQRPELERDNDFSTKDQLMSLYMRLSVGWIDPRFVYGSPGA